MKFRLRRHLIVVYHASCIDGLASAWAFEQKWGPDPLTHLSFIPLGHHDLPEAENMIRAEVTPEAEIHFVDVAPSRQFLDELMSAGQLKSISVTDHHKSAADALAGYAAPVHENLPALELHFDSQAPAASGMVWDKLMANTPKPVFLKMIEKMDLARDISDDDDLAAAALIDSKGLRSVADAFQAFSELADMQLGDMIDAGKSILADQHNRIAKLTDNILYTRVTVPDEDAGDTTLWIPAINADVQNFGRHISDYLREQGDRTGLNMAFAWYVQGNGTVTMSIRSDGDPDASEIAEIICRQPGVKGGGHKTSAAVHFASLRQFTELMPLYTEGQMNVLKLKEDLAAAD
ncbi:MAG TPA: DHH family phosphoesterase [Patescibacteria group bacterium]|nr:DHH family phosphoesterase [Patescibacteria group bacterium]